MKAILTVTGNDKVGIVARVTAKLAELNINILDLSQTILQGNFTMVMLVDLEKCEKNFDVLHYTFEELGNEMDLNIRIQRSEVFDAMHSI